MQIKVNKLLHVFKNASSIFSGLSLVFCSLLLKNVFDNLFSLKIVTLCLEVWSLLAQRPRVWITLCSFHVSSLNSALITV